MATRNCRGRAAQRGQTLACLAILLCLALVAPGGPAVAQESGTGATEAPAPQTGLSIGSLRVQVMPEFDNPRVLVVVQGRLTDSTSLPTTVTFRLPMGASINQMAVMSMDGGTIAQDYEALPDAADSRWLAVSYTLTNAHFFYEYYYDPLGSDANKEFGFVLNSLYPVEDLLLEVQEPARASSFRLEPQPAGSRVDSSLGLTYHQLQVGRVAAGEDVSIAVRYIKADPTPSLSWQQVMALEDAQAPSAPALASAPAGAAQGSGAGPMLAALAGAALALVVLGVAYAVWRSPRPSPAAGPSHARACPVCGAPLRAGALFCYSCGAPSPTPRRPAAEPHQRDGAAGRSPLEVRL